MENKIDYKRKSFAKFRALLLLASFVLVSLNVLVACSVAREHSETVILEANQRVVDIERDRVIDNFMDFSEFTNQQKVYMPYIEGGRYVLDAQWPVNLDRKFDIYEKEYSLDGGLGVDFKIGVEHVLTRTYVRKDGKPSVGVGGKPYHVPAYVYAYRATMQANRTSQLAEDGTLVENQWYRRKQASSTVLGKKVHGDDEHYITTIRHGPFNNERVIGIGARLSRNWLDRDGYKRGVFDRVHYQSSGVAFEIAYNYSHDIAKFGKELKGVAYSYGFFMFGHYDIFKLKINHDFEFYSTKNGVPTTAKARIVTSFRQG